MFSSRRTWLLTWRTRRGRRAIKLPLVLVAPLAFVLFIVCTPLDLLVRLLVWTVARPNKPK
ncbi:hypothetical protein AWB76_00192 [Caballeronia temeraria]|uniref:Uncharacterized protein n=1 Tax=Caballeronia temeraria TaxID=1777137 RepID=A0A157Z565_9BURK|nr:hypothetical protein [Caballeronia temeraria]SAK40632.1 hypothetical protein AWB76_00192 [Caballeronia temeraria]